MFTCSVSVFLLLICSFSFLRVCFCFHYTFRALFRLALISVVAVVVYFILQNLFTSTDVSSLRVVVCVCSHCLHSLFCFVLFHKGKIILSVNMSVCGCMCEFVMIIIIVFVYFFFVLFR